MDQRLQEQIAQNADEGLEDLNWALEAFAVDPGNPAIGAELDKRRLERERKVEELLDEADARSIAPLK
jgi:hypothetical protein